MIQLHMIQGDYWFEYSAGAKAYTEPVEVNTSEIKSSSIEWKRCDTFFAT